MGQLISVEEAVSALLSGGVVGIPTETVYGLSADGLSAQSVARVFAAKGRPADNPLILHVPDVHAARPLWTLTQRCERRVERLAALWPGPVTAVLRAAAHIPPIVTAGLPTVAVRAPAHPVAQSILRQMGRPLAAPSANRSGRPSPTTAQHVLDDLGGLIDGVVDGGACDVGVESTVVDLYSEVPRILRPGAIGREALARAIGETVMDYVPDATAGSPGLRHQHYRPSVNAVEAVGDVVQAWTGPDALLMFASTAGELVGRVGRRAAPTQLLPDTPSGAMRSVYAALRSLEQSGAERLLIELPPPGSQWSAMRDRLERAVGNGR